ncbi:MAG TPA: hypothetical protein DCE41_35205 [Cytophagales bacterium]|nr:hypothetical protein [Cytophagales bacterium]HAP58639.1 hypothetical protein [Cytophagales bacterium]
MKTQTEPPKGLKCPNERCGTLIKFSYLTLLAHSEITCPNCGLQLKVQVPAEVKEHLQELVHAEELVEKARTFKR